MRVIWSPQALADVESIWDYISKDNPAAASRLAVALLAAGDSLESFGSRGRPGVVAGTRQLVVMRRYILDYQVREDFVEILQVWHGARLRP